MPTNNNFIEVIAARCYAYGYDGYGYAVMKRDNGNYCIIDISHCSCYDSWDAATNHLKESKWGDESTIKWEGSKAELLYLAKLKLDFAMPERTISAQDSDYTHVIELYEMVIKILGDKNES